MDHHTPLISILSIGLGLAFVLGIIAAKFRLSPIIGYIITGIIIGPFTPGFEANAELAHEISEMGVILLMFGVGLHFSLKDLSKFKNIAIPGAILQIIASVFFGYLAGKLLDLSLVASLTFGLSLSTASTVVLLKALESKNLLSTTRGQIAIGWLIVEDVIVVLALVTLPAVAILLKIDSTINGTDNLLNILKTIGLILLKLTSFIIIMILIGKRLIPALIRRAAKYADSELFNLSVIAIALGITYAAAYFFDVSFSLGAFFAGMVLHESELSHRAANSTLPLRDIFGVLFFVSIGMIFNFNVIYQEPIATLLTVSIIIFAKSLVAYMLVRLFRHPRITAITISVSLAQIGELSFVLSGLAVSLDLMGANERNFIVAGSVISIMLNPLMFYIANKIICKDCKEQDLDVVVNEDSIIPKDLDDLDETKVHITYKVNDHVILVGSDDYNKILNYKYREHNINSIVVTSNNILFHELIDSGCYSVFGDDKDISLYKEYANLGESSFILFTCKHPYEYSDLIAKIRLECPNLHIMAYANHNDEKEYLIDIGVNRVIIGKDEILDSFLIKSIPYIETSKSKNKGLFTEKF